MAFTPQTYTDFGASLTALETRIKAAFDALPSSSTSPGKGCWVNRAAAFSAPSGGPTAVPLDHEQFNDDATYYSLGSGKLTVLKAGLYLVTGSTVMTGGDAAGRSFQITVNGATINDFGLSAVSSLGASGSTVVRLVAGDQIGLSVYVGGANAATLDVSAPRCNSIRAAYLGS